MRVVRKWTTVSGAEARAGFRCCRGASLVRLHIEKDQTFKSQTEVGEKAMSVVQAGILTMTILGVLMMMIVVEAALWCK